MTPDAERRLWSQGVGTWDEFLSSKQKWDLGEIESASMSRVIKNSQKKLADFDHKYFARKIASKEHWRMFPEFESKLVYLDIETDGGWAGSSVTMIGVYDGSEFRAFIKGQDLHEFPEYMSQFKAMVTFFGTGFDIPMLRKLYPLTPFDQLHIDLCPTMRRLGYRGGLKKIERELEIWRGEDTEGLSGRDAIFLWKRYLQGEKRALELLVEYNREDVVNLKTIMQFAYKTLKRETVGNV